MAHGIGVLAEGANSPSERTFESEEGLFRISLTALASDLIRDIYSASPPGTAASENDRDAASGGQ